MEDISERLRHNNTPLIVSISSLSKASRTGTSGLGTLPECLRPLCARSSRPRL
ncbi:MAG: hypothetical protein JWM59_1410 [Verrucomicrobiales bacterium]|nr:hypothetical protein [Verrucomicrobiales bacterium]